MTPLNPSLYANRMRHLCLWALLSFVACAPASASDPGDAMDSFLSSRGLLGQSPQQAPAAPVAPARTAPPVQNFSAEDSQQRMSGLVVAAMGALGVAYQRGGNDYASGFDCSGFVRALYQQNFNLLLPRRAVEQAGATHAIERHELKPGDLVFFNTLGRIHSHVGIYVGEHRFIHSPKSGAVVRIEDMRVNYWNRRFDGARRVVGQSRAALAQSSATAPPAPLTNY